MTEINECPLCNSVVEQRALDCPMGQIGSDGKEIIVPKVKTYHCTNPNCEHSWLPHEEERRIDLWFWLYSWPKK